MPCTRRTASRVYEWKVHSPSQVTAAVSPINVMVAIDEIDWSKLVDASGPANDVPLWLVQLSSDDAEATAEAIDALFGLIWHQGAIYTSSIAALPILAQYLADDEQKHRDALAALIASIVTGSCWYQGADEWPQIVRAGQELVLKERGTTIEQEKDKERPIINAARRFGAQIVHSLIPFLTSTDPESRQMIARAVAMFPDAAREGRRVVREALERESEDWVREALAIADAELAKLG